jgi:cytoskeletal protein RodZ
MSVGVLIKQARSSGRVSIKKLSGLTKIPAAILTDLEKDIFTTCGGLTYAKGHIKNIAKALKADPELFLQEFALMTQEPERPMIDLLKDNSVVTSRKSFPQMSVKTLALSGAVLAAIFVAVPVANGLMGASHSVAKLSVTVPIAKKVVQKQPHQSAVISGAKVSGATVEASTGSTWLAVKNSAGMSLFSGLLIQGTSKTFDNSQVIDMTIGNAGAVKVRVNGKEVGPLGKPGVVVHMHLGPGSSL